jgi:hypothetical protein
MIIGLITEFLRPLQFDFTVLQPKVSEFFSQNLDLGRGTDFNISKGKFFIIKRFCDGGSLNLDSFDRTKLFDLIYSCGEW